MIPPEVVRALHAEAGPGDSHVDDVRAEPIAGGTGAATGSVTRLSGRTPNGPFSVVAKQLRPVRTGRHTGGAADPAHWAYWRREALAYASGLLPAGPGLRAPRCYGVVADTVYLEDVPAQPEDTATASARLADWQARTPIPDTPWLARDQLAQRIAVSDLDLSAVDLGPALQRIWARRHDLLAGLAYATPAVSHGDFHLGQLSAAGESTVALDWGTFGIAAAGADHAHLALSAVTDLYADLEPRARPGYRATLALTGASRAHWMAMRGIALPDGYRDLVTAYGGR